MTKSKRKWGADLQVGDTIHVWFIRPSGCGTIIGFRPLNQRCGWMERVAIFQEDVVGMTIEPNSYYMLHQQNINTDSEGY